MDSMISAYEELDRAILMDLEEAICNYWRVKYVFQMGSSLLLIVIVF